MLSGLSSTIRIFATVLTIRGKKYASVQANAKPGPRLDAGPRMTKRQVLMRLRIGERPEPGPPGLGTAPAR